MVDADTVGVPAARRHLIRRPRLTKLLDESGARLILLVAPAGFGKTTLAQQWMEDKQHAWYRGGPASADVAALAAGIAEAAAKLVPGCDTRIRERLAVTRDPEAEARVLAEIVAEDLAGWPTDCWFVFDDYQYAMESTASEAFVEALLDRSAIKLFVTTRARPRWATARRATYGEAIFVTRSALAMRPEETEAVLGSVASAFHAARGWPAIIGLVAQARAAGLIQDLKGRIEEYIAELYDEAPTDSVALATLAVLPVLTNEIASRISHSSERDLVTAALRLGALVPTGESYEVHPLWRNTLRRRFSALSRVERQERLAPVLALLIQRGQWDDAFSLIRDFGVPDALAPLFRSSLYELIGRGRLATLAKWIAFARETRVDDAIVVLAQAEVAFREGKYFVAKVLADQGARELASDTEFHVKALLRAGFSSLLNSDYEAADQAFAQAAALASSESEKREALIGRFFAQLDLEHPDATQRLAEAEALDSPTSAAHLRVATARLLLASRVGGIEHALSEAFPVITIASSVQDPLVRSAFHYVLAGVYADAGRYQEALAQATRALRLGDQYRLDHVRWHGLDVRARALIGLREFEEARRLIDRVAEAATTRGDVYAVANAQILRARLALCSGNPAAAQEGRLQVGSLSRGMSAEYLAARALVERKFFGGDEATGLALLARGLTVSQEAHAFMRWLDVVAVRPTESKFSRLAAAAFEETLQVGHIDAFVCCYRAWPAVLDALRRRGDWRATLGIIMQRAADTELAQARGIPVQEVQVKVGVKALTRREAEVFELVRRGFSNKEIATELSISEPTAKLHVRRILAKVGARSRTEAVARAPKL